MAVRVQLPSRVPQVIQSLEPEHQAQHFLHQIPGTMKLSSVNLLVKILTVVLLAASVFGCVTKRQKADLIIFGGTIHTLDSSNASPQAIAVAGDTILYVGSQEEAMKLKHEKTYLLDLKGKTLTPGFIEGHGHIMGLGYNELNLDLMGVESMEAIADKVKDAASKLKPGEWIVGRGWHQDKWTKLPNRMVKGLPTHDLITKASPNNPVALAHASGHSVLVNAKAMEIIGVSGTSSEKIQVPVGGEIFRDELGNPTGIFNETAEALVEKVIPAANADSDRKALELAIAACSRNGITGFHSAGESQRTIDLIKQFSDQNKLPVRMYLMLSGSDSDLINRYLISGPIVDKWVTIRAIKLYGDGALGSRGAWLLEDYSDAPGIRGQANMVMDSVLTIARRALRSGFQVCTHAIGDRANREVLDRYEKALLEFPQQAAAARFRIEHAQHIHPDDIPRFGKLGVIPAMQAIHLSSDRPWAIDRLGKKRIEEGAYMWQRLLQTGAVVVNGSDVPVEPISPIASFYASVTRKTLKGFPENGFEADQKLTRLQALRSYTLDAAYGAFEEKFKGSIEVGKLADFTIFTQDLLNCAEEDILKTKVAMTIVGGQVVFEHSK